MRSRKLAIVIIGSLVFLFGVTFAAWAGGAGGVYGCCVVDNPGGGAIALQGTVTVVYSPPVLLVPAYIDVKLRLERGGKFAFFELHLNENIFGWDNYEIMCVILNPKEPKPTNDQGSVSAVQALVNDILTTFFPMSGLNNANRRLVITRKSITLTDGNAGEEIPGTGGRRAAIGDVVVYVVDPANARLESNPNCP